MKKILALILCGLLGFCAVPIVGVTAEDSAVQTQALSYSFANDFIANADGVIKYNGALTADQITAAKLYWADQNGEKLDGFLPFAETDGATLISGYKITDSRLIPKGAAKALAELTTADATVNEFADIPAEKQNSGDDIYSTLFVSDSHVNADEVNNLYMDKASMVKRFSLLKDSMDSLAAQGDNVIGISLIGDVVVGKHISTGGHGVWEAYEEDYTVTNEVLAETGIEAAYPIYYINGNHDIIYCENGDGSTWINFLDQKINDYNTAVGNSIYPENIMSAIASIEKESGKYWYDTYINGYHYIYLSVPYGGFGINEEQLVWLDTLLAKDAQSNKPAFVIGHYPMSYTHEDAAGHFDNSADLEAVLEKYPNTVYISGHTHISPEVNPDNVLIGNNETTKINTGALISTVTDADGNKVYKPSGVYCKVFSDRVEFHSRIFCNMNDDTAGYWVSGTSKVLSLKNTVNSGLSADISADSEKITNGTTLTATADGKLLDTDKYECKWYVDNTLVGTGATHTLSYYFDREESLVTPSGSISICVTDLSDATNSVWVYFETEAEIFKEISTAEELAKIGVDADYPLDGKYILTNDIDLSNYGNWTPIGKMTLGTDGFTGVFDGNGHTIKGMTVNITELPDDGSAHLSGGLFAHTIAASISNLVMKNASVTLSNSKLYCFAGVISGDSEADTAGNSTTYSNIAVINSSVTVPSAYNVVGAGAITGAINRKYTKNRNAGAQFTDCYSNTDISVSTNNPQICAGGLGGYAYNTKTPITITNCIFDGTISGTEKSCRGGLIGKTVNPVTTVTNGYSNSDKFTQSEAAEAIYPISGTTLSASELTASTVTSLGLSDKWVNSEQGPVLKLAEYELFYADYIKISNGTQLAKIGVDENYPLDGKYILTNDIDLSSFESWTPIGDINNTDDRTAETPKVFWGTLDGDGHAIRNMTIDWTTGFDSDVQVFVGLFAATRGATVKNVVFDNANISVTNVKNQNFAGVIAGSAEASNKGVASHYSNIYITNSTLTMNSGKSAVGIGSFAGATNKRSTRQTVGGLKLTDCYSNADIINKRSDKQSCAGGFVGYAYATKTTGLEFTDSVFEGTITCTGNLHWKGAVVGRASGPTATYPTYYTVTNVYTTAGIENTGTDESNINIGSTGDYDSAADLAKLGFGNTNWYDTPVGARQRLTMTAGDIDASGNINATDLTYLSKYLLGTETKVDSTCADVNGDSKNNILDLIRIKKQLAG